MLIQITDEYAITSDQYSWQIAKRCNRNRDGKKVVEWAAIFWYSTFEGAVNGLVEYQIRLSNAQTLADALIDAKSVVADLCKALQPQIDVQKVA